MNINSHLTQIGLSAAVVVAAALLASCAPFQSSPKQVDSSNPTVSYKYRNDDELIQTNQLAATFCSQYQSVPRAMTFSLDADGDKVVTFDCVSTSDQSASPFNPNLNYTYRTDQELLVGSQSAQAYCVNNGSSRVVSNVVRNSDDSRTVTFQCKVD